MEMLLNEIMKRGGNKNRIEVKIFDGASLVESRAYVGHRNAAWAFKYLKKENLNLLMSNVGDFYPRKVYYFTDSGQVLMKKINRIKNNTIIDREQVYQNLEQETSSRGEAKSDVPLF